MRYKKSVLKFAKGLWDATKRLYAARAPGYLGNAIVATISTSVCCGGGASGSSTIPSGTDTPTIPSGTDTSTDTSTVPSGGATFTDKDVEDVFDDGMGIFTPEDVLDVFDDDFTATGETPEDDDIDDVFDDDEGECEKW